MGPGTVGVVVTTYNYGRYLLECLQSLDAQTRAPDAIVVVDDGSDDDTADVLAIARASLGIADRLRVIRHDHRQGQAASINEGVRACDCDLVAHVDADDTCEPAYLEQLETALATHPGAGYAYPRMRLTGTESGVYASFAFHPGRLIFEGNYIPNVALMRREAFLATEGIRELPTHVDWDLWLSMLAAGWPGVLVDEVLYNWRRHPGSLSDRAERTRLGVRFGIWWRHRGLVARHSAVAPRWLWSAVWRRVRLHLPGTPALVRTRSAWVQNDARR
jgi:glycosyltransferase involved in cell wall biosynthesis